MAIHVEEAEALRYMGVPPEAADAQTLACLERAAETLAACAAARHVLLTFPLHLEENAVSLGGCVFESASLAAHLRGCPEAVLFAATLGAEADRCMLRASASGNVLEALALQACAASAIERYCDDCCAALAADEAKRGLYPLPRFSPGYGDLSLAYQRPLLRLLQADRTLGLSLTEGCMLTPTKSVTAVIGLSPRAACAPKPKCAACPKRDCAFRKAY